MRVQRYAVAFLGNHYQTFLAQLLYGVRATGIAWNTLKELFPHFVKDVIAVETRKIGRATMYKLTEKHPKSVLLR
jgi:hypothetical protein